MTHKTKRAPVHGFKVLSDVGAAEGIFEAIVAVFNNVDHVGDRILPGAFTDSLAAWKADGDPIPVIFSHRWDDLDAHIGEVLDAVELAPGDARLPDAIKDLGGLYVKATVATDEDFAGRVWRKMARRTLREFSFAYDIIEEATPDQPVDASHRNDLIKLGIIEVGPTLKGCNPVTQLIGAKARAAGKTGAADLLDQLGELTDVTDLLDDDGAGGLLDRALETVLADPDHTIEEELDDVAAGGLPEVKPEDLEALGTALDAATDELLGTMRGAARTLVEAAFVAASTTKPAGGSTVPGQEDEANAGGKGRPRSQTPATTSANLDALALEVDTL